MNRRIKFAEKIRKCLEKELKDKVLQTNVISEPKKSLTIKYASTEYKIEVKVEKK